MKLKYLSLVLGVFFVFSLFSCGKIAEMYNAAKNESLYSLLSSQDTENTQKAVEKYGVKQIGTEVAKNPDLINNFETTVFPLSCDIGISYAQLYRGMKAIENELSQNNQIQPPCILQDIFFFDLTKHSGEQLVAAWNTPLEKARKMACSSRESQKLNDQFKAKESLFSWPHCFEYYICLRCDESETSTPETDDDAEITVPGDGGPTTGTGEQE